MIAFIDFEASSLTFASYPIEVGWVLEDGVGESHLIQPVPSWNDWDLESAAMHGITREMLAADGVPAADVARRLHQVLASHDVYTDAPTADQIWLTTLMRTAGLLPMPLRHIYDSYKVIFRPAIKLLPHTVASSLAQSVVMQAEREIEATGGVRHRAEPDARRHWMTWHRVRVLATDVMDGWP
jgi:hypothetical protein